MATTTRDIVQRFTVEDLVTPAIKKIDNAIAGMDRALKQLGGDYDALSRESKKVYNDQVRGMKAFDDAAKSADKIVKMQRDLAKMTGLTAEQQKAYNAQIEKTKLLLAEELALGQRNALERRRSVTGGGGGGATLSAMPTGGGDSLANAFTSASKAGDSLIGTINKVSFSLFVLTFGTQQMGELFLRTFVQVGEQVEMQKTRIELLTASTKTFGMAVEASMDLGVSLESFTGSLSRLAVANQQMGLTNDELVQMTKTITQLGVVGGGTAQEVAAGMQQLAQGFASGRLQGDELRSVMENMPYLAVKLADAMNIPIGSFREAGAAGELTGKRMSDALKKVKDDAEKMFNDLPVTSERGLARISTQWDLMINTMLQAVGTGTVGQFFTDIAASMESFNQALADNQGAVSVWLSTIGNVVKVTGGLAAAWFLLLRPAAGLVSAFTAWRTAALAATAANAALAASQAAVAAGTASVAAALEAETAARVANTAATRAAWAAWGPAAAVFAVAAVAAYSFYEAQQKVAEGVQKTVDGIDELTEKLPTLSRAQLAVARDSIAKAIEAKRAELVSAAESLRMGGTWNGMFGFTAEETNALRLRIEELETALSKLVGAQRTGEASAEGLAEANKKAAAAFSGLGKEMEKLNKDTDDLNKKFEGLVDRLAQVARHGEDAGNAIADQNDAFRDYQANVNKTQGAFNALANPTADDATVHAERMRMLRENYDAQMRVNAAEKARQVQQQASKDDTKAMSAETRERISLLDAEISARKAALEKVASIMSRIDDEQERMAAEVGAGGGSLEAMERIMAEGQKAADAEKKIRAEILDLETQRNALDGPSKKAQVNAGMERHNALLQEMEANTRAVLEAEKERKALQKFERGTADIRAGNLEGEAKFAAERDAAIQALGESEITNLEALNDRKLALQEKYVRDVKDLRQQEIDALAGDIAGAMTQAFTAMADSGDGFNEVLERLVKSFRDMVVQLTVIKPLAQGMATLINGAFGANDSADKSSWISTAIGALVKSAYADGGVVGTGLAHGVYSTPTLFPMSSPGRHAFAAGTGLLGEAGPEAVLPLSRGADGKLGVSSSGAALNVVVNTLPGQTADVRQEGGTLTIDIIEQALASRVARGGSSLPKAVEASYAGMRRQGR